MKYIIKINCMISPVSFYLFNMVTGKFKAACVACIIFLLDGAELEFRLSYSNKEA